MEGSGGNTNQDKPQENHPKELPKGLPAEPRPNLEAKPSGNQDGNGNRQQPSLRDVFPPPEPQRWYTNLSVTDWITAVSTAIIMVWAGLQWYEMHTSGNDTHTLAQQAVTQATQTTSLATNAGTQATAATNFATSAGEIDTKIGLAEADFAKMAKNSEGTIKATQESMRQDQRAWVFANGFRLSEEPTSNHPITVTISIINSGKTPALDVLPMSHPSDRSDEPPEVNDWTTVAKGTRKRGLLPPGITGLTFTTAPLTLTNGLGEYDAGTNSIYVQAKIIYLDTFKKSHWTTVCVLHRHGRPMGEFDFCERGNDMDR